MKHESFQQDLKVEVTGLNTKLYELRNKTKSVEQNSCSQESSFGAQFVLLLVIFLVIGYSMCRLNSDREVGHDPSVRCFKCASLKRAFRFLDIQDIRIVHGDSPVHARCCIDLLAGRYLQKLVKVITLTTSNCRSSSLASYFDCHFSFLCILFISQHFEVLPRVLAPAFVQVYLSFELNNAFCSLSQLMSLSPWAEYMQICFCFSVLEILSVCVFVLRNQDVLETYLRSHAIEGTEIIKCKGFLMFVMHVLAVLSNEI